MAYFVIRPGVKYATLPLVVMGIVADNLPATGLFPLDGLDHTVPRVPVVVAAASGGVSTSTIIYASNWTTGDEASVLTPKKPDVEHG